jgi:hypothetical protein
MCATSTKGLESEPERSSAPRPFFTVRVLNRSGAEQEDRHSSAFAQFPHAAGRSPLLGIVVVSTFFVEAFVNCGENLVVLIDHDPFERIGRFEDRGSRVIGQLAVNQENAGIFERIGIEVTFAGFPRRL